jgi:hypothetical protein
MKFLSNCTTGGSSRRVELHGVGELVLYASETVHILKKVAKVQIFVNEILMKVFRCKKVYMHEK